MSKAVSALVVILMLGLVGKANAAEPVVLTDAQMDEVTAGVTPAQLARISAGVKYIRKAAEILTEAAKQAGPIARDKLAEAKNYVLKARAYLKPVSSLLDAYSAVQLYRDVVNYYKNVHRQVQTIPTSTPAPGPRPTPPVAR